MPFRAFATPKQHRQPSLFGEILDWLLAPLMILWPVSMAVEYSLAYGVANTAYDRELKDSVVIIARQLMYEQGEVALRNRDIVANMLIEDEITDTVFQLRGVANEVVDGEGALPGVDFQPDLRPEQVYFRNDRLRNQDVRVAYMFAQVRGLNDAVLVQVAETDEKRALLASSIIGGVLAAQFLLLPLALVLVWFGLSKGIAPLEEMRGTIRNRRSQDLSPIDPADAPEEIRPFIHSINDLMERLDQSMKAQQRFVADAAHQMRTPLAGLKTQAELALRQRDLQGIEHTMRQIASGADRASRLISQLLLLARAEGENASPMQRVDLHELLRTVTGEWAPQALAKNIDLGFEAGEEPAAIHGNALLLQELFNNLLDNAIRYTPDGGKVTLAIRDGADFVLVDVRDSGIGIDPAEHQLVFDRFYRVLGTSSDGSGLGLAIVREIAELHRGRVELVEAAAGCGALFRVMLPRQALQPVPLRKAA